MVNISNFSFNYTSVVNTDLLFYANQIKEVFYREVKIIFVIGCIIWLLHVNRNWLHKNTRISHQWLDVILSGGIMLIVLIALMLLTISFELEQPSFL
jgi:hypothetical protein